MKFLVRQSEKGYWFDEIFGNWLSENFQKTYRKIVESWRERWRVTIVYNDVDGHFSFEARNVAVSEVSAEFVYLSLILIKKNNN